MCQHGCDPDHVYKTFLASSQNPTSCLLVAPAYKRTRKEDQCVHFLLLSSPVPSWSWKLRPPCMAIASCRAETSQPTRLSLRHLWLDIDQPTPHHGHIEHGCDIACCNLTQCTVAKITICWVETRKTHTLLVWLRQLPGFRSSHREDCGLDYGRSQAHPVD